MSVDAVTFGGVSMVVGAAGAEAESVVAFALRHLARAEVRADTPRLDLVAKDGVALLTRGDEVLARAASAGEALDALMGHLTHHLADRGAEPLLHAALVIRGGGAWLLPADSGAGKSTLTAWLCARGARLATDELVRVAGERAEGLTRPVHLKAGSRTVADALLAGRVPGGDVHLRWEGGDFLHAEALGQAPHVGLCRVAGIVFPRWTKGAPASLRPVRPAEAARRVMEHLVDARNLEGHGMRAMADLARGAPAHELAYGDLAEAERSLDALRAP